MPETPHERFEYPTKAYPAWFQNGAIIDADGREIEQEYDGIVDWLEQLEVSVVGEVETLDDLPEPDEDTVNERTGERRVYLVADDAIFYYDNGENWIPIGLQSMSVADSNLDIGSATRLNFSNQISATITGDGETARIDAEIDGEHIEPDSAHVGVELKTPVYPDTSSANGDVARIIYVTGSGSDPAGLYYHNGNEWSILESGTSGATSLSELSIDTNKNWGGYNISNLGDVSADSVSASAELEIPVYDGQDPNSGNFWIRSDR